MKNGINLEFCSRQYNIAIADSNGIEVVQNRINHMATSTSFGINEIFDNSDDYEYKHAIQEITDKILDLKAGESMYFQPCRDNKETKGIITRIK